MATPVRHLREHEGETVTIRGWLGGKRSSGEIGFLQVRDGSGTVQCVVSRAEVSAEAWEDLEAVTLESSVRVTGVPRADEQASAGVEIHATDFKIRSLAAEYPIAHQEHDTAFRMEHRHLWLRSSRQRAALRVRSEVCQAIRDFFYEREFTLVDTPILTPTARAGTSTSFHTDCFGDPADLSQSGQLYLEPAAAALGKVYCMGPIFRAEPSESRRRLVEFWMVEPEVAFLELNGLVRLAESFVISLVSRVLERCQEELAVLERDTAPLEKVTAKFPHITYREAIEILRTEGQDVAFGDHLGAEHETILAAQHDRPLFVSRLPTAMKAFYMQPDPEDPEVVLSVDLLAPEGYGEIIGGSQRIHDHDLLLARIQAHDLPVEAFQWYLDVRKYGTFPHSGFGMGIERFVAWVCGLSHLRETIPYPRMPDTIYP